MSAPFFATPAEVDALLAELLRNASGRGFHLNPDTGFVRELVAGLLVNRKRYGYASCPCRLASGKEEQDLDIICPCDYREADVDEHGACFCALYVSAAVAGGKAKAGVVPERRGREKAAKGHVFSPAGLSKPVWRCRVCGYLCAADSAPETCPICGAQRERFERFM